MERVEILIRFNKDEKIEMLKTQFISNLHDVPTAGSLINRFYPLEALINEGRKLKEPAIFPEAG